MLDYDSIGRRIRQLRIQKYLTQEELGEDVGISAKHLSNIETNNSQPSIEVLVALANRLDTSPDYLLMNNATKMQTANFQIEFDHIMKDCTPTQRIILMDYMESCKQLLKKHKIN